MGMGARCEFARSVINTVLNGRPPKAEKSAVPPPKLNLPEGFTPASLFYDRKPGPVPQVRILYDFGDFPKTKKPTSRDMDG